MNELLKKMLDSADKCDILGYSQGKPMSDLIRADFYKADIFRFYFEKLNSTVDMVISNSISWDTNRYSLTREELKGLADFINKFLET